MLWDAIFQAPKGYAVGTPFELLADQEATRGKQPHFQPLCGPFHTHKRYKLCVKDLDDKAWEECHMLQVKDLYFNTKSKGKVTANSASSLITREDLPENSRHHLFANASKRSGQTSLGPVEPVLLNDKDPDRPFADVHWSRGVKISPGQRWSPLVPVAGRGYMYPGKDGTLVGNVDMRSGLTAVKQAKTVMKRHNDGLESAAAYRSSLKLQKIRKSTGRKRQQRLSLARYMKPRYPLYMKIRERFDQLQPVGLLL